MKSFQVLGIITFIGIIGGVIFAIYAASTYKGIPPSIIYDKDGNEIIVN